MSIMMPADALSQLRVNPDWATLPLFDRTGWTRMAFGDFAQSIGERVEPKDAADEVYVGLEHLDSQNLHIQRWGKGSDVTGTKLRFRKGDIIFGRRRAYQRKLAVAEFDGICSAHAMVVRAKPERVLPEFLPFLMMSDRFMNRAVEISVGSLSPTINWTALKREEFDLPPLAQQSHIARVLDCVVHEQHALWVLATKLEEVRLAVIEDFVCGRKARSGGTFAWPSKSIGALSDISSGKVNSSAAVEDGEYPFFTCAPEVSRASTYSYDCEALLLAGNNAQGVYTVKHFKGKFLARQRVYVVRIRDRSEMDYRFLHLMMQRSLGQMQSLSVGTTSKHITLGDLQGVCVPCPPVSEQEVFVRRIQALAEARARALAGLRAAAALHKGVAELVCAAR